MGPDELRRRARKRRAGTADELNESDDQRVNFAVPGSCIDERCGIAVLVVAFPELLMTTLSEINARVKSVMSGLRHTD